MRLSKIHVQLVQLVGMRIIMRSINLVELEVLGLLGDQSGELEIQDIKLALVRPVWSTGEIIIKKLS